MALQNLFALILYHLVQIGSVLLLNVKGDRKNITLLFLRARKSDNYCDSCNIFRKKNQEKNGS